MLDAPKSLIERTQWFGKALQDIPHESEAKRYILPSKELTGLERVKIYHQQYWWRLRGILAEQFPSLVASLGREEFYTKVAYPFLKKHPPDSFLLSDLGARLPLFLPKGKERDLAEIDWACHRAFSVGHTTPHLEDVESKKLTLQDHIYLFDFQWDAFNYRENLIGGKQGKVIQGGYCFILYRNLKNEVRWSELSGCEYFILKMFRIGITLDEMSERVETSTFKEEAEEFLPIWFRNWVVNEWLV